MNITYVLEMGAAYLKPPSSRGNTNHGYFLPKTACAWLAIAFLSLALLHLLCCSLPGAHQTFFSPVLQYFDHTYSYFSPSTGDGGGRSCNYSEGRWVRSPGYARRYNATECNAKESHDCIRNGRPDTGYLDWRWQPAGCRLPAFDAPAFLSEVRGKHVAFIGDSMARNQAESLVCLLSAASPYNLVYRDPEPWTRQFWRWSFPEYGVTVSVYWAPFLAKATGKLENYTMPYNMVHLDRLADRWVADADTMDVVVLAAGHWFLNPVVYYNGSEVVGAHLNTELNHTQVGFFDQIRAAYRMSVERLSAGRSKTVLLATFSPTHFRGKSYFDHTACTEKEPDKEGEKELDSVVSKLRNMIVEEAEAAAARTEGKGGPTRFEVLDVTKLASMRPDGHPGPYMNRDPFAHGVQERTSTDCLHFCLPGPVDTFNEVLLHILTTGRRTDG